MATQQDKQYVKCYCYSCKRETNHFRIHTSTMCSNDEDYLWKRDFSIVKCCGCESISFLTETMEEGTVEYDDFGNESYSTVKECYPYDKPFTDMYIRHLWSVPQSVAITYREIQTALDAKCYLLAAAGFRMIVEAICADKKVEGKSLEVMINNLCKKGYITHADRDRLHSIRFMGNDSVHQMKKPDIACVHLVLEIVHNMLNNLYILADECKNILEGPISDYDDFEVLLNQGIASRFIGDIDTLRNLVQSSRRLIKDDLSTFEAKLQERITNGIYTKLSLQPAPTNGGRQQYKIESL